MPTPKVFRDPVHNIISLERSEPADRLLLDLIDTPELQRLRRVRQLGLAHFVFHGAEHSRFGHSLGAMHVARLMLDQLARGTPLTTADRLPVLAAALVHDVGHGPLSHNAEALFGEPHELRSRSVIMDPDTGVGGLLAAWDAELPEAVARCVTGCAQPRLLGGIVSGQLDCDRLDYILRDGWALGVEVRYDLARLLGMLGGDRIEDRLVVDARGRDAVEGYLIARHHLYRNAYHHKTVRAAGAMLGAAFRRAAALLATGALDGSGLPGGLIACLRGRLRMQGELLELDDSDVWAALKAWGGHADPTLSRLAGGLVQRRLFKGVRVTRLAPDRRAELRPRVEHLLRAGGYVPEYHLLEDRARDQAYRPYAPDLGREGIFIRWPDATREISETSGVVRALFQASEDIRWFVPGEVRAEVRRMVGATG